MKDGKTKDKAKIKDSKGNLERLRSLSYLLDEAIPIPGTSYRIGIDPLIGLFPGAGDYLSAAFSAYIILESAKMGASKATLSRMLMNVVVDTLVGNIPLLGDFFDATWKGNSKNMELLENYINSPKEREKTDWLFIIVIILGLIGIVTIVAVINIFILRLIFQIINGN